ncbi:dTMP kinase [Candidatus Poribacteria bacterium]|nr:dTMP kinase [Candidatus Poribacteria bacterium]
MNKRELFVTFEGIEGAGKSTQARLLEKYVSELGYPVFLTREPGGTFISEQIRKIILEPQNTKMTEVTELFLYLASRAQHVKEIILPNLNKGVIVICDRFSDATLAYQGYARGLDVDFLKEINKVATDGLEPDLTVLLDMEVKDSLLRKQDQVLNRIDKENFEFHNKVRRGYLEIAKKEPDRVKVVDANSVIDNVHKNITRLIDDLLSGCF